MNWVLYPDYNQTSKAGYQIKTQAINIFPLNYNKTIPLTSIAIQDISGQFCSLFYELRHLPNPLVKLLSYTESNTSTSTIKHEQLQ